MELKQNASVLTANGENVGRLDRVVMEPATKGVTHVVVRQGMLFTEDKTVGSRLLDELREYGRQPQR